MQDLYDGVLKCAEGAAIATDCTCETEIVTAMHQKFSNRALAEVIQGNIETVGMPRWNEEEEESAKRIQREMGAEETGLKEKPEELKEANPAGVSTDVGDVSLAAPTATLGFPVRVPGSPGHHWSIVAATPTSIGHKGMIAGAKVLALSALDLLLNPDLLTPVKEEFSELQRSNPYIPFIPEDKKPEVDFYASEAERWRSAKLEDWSAYWNGAFGSMEIKG